MPASTETIERLGKLFSQETPFTRVDLVELTHPEFRIHLEDLGVTPKQIIEKTRDGFQFGTKLSPAEIFAWVNDYTEGKVTDYQASAWLMAVRMREWSADARLSLPETVALTLAMAASGEVLNLDRLGIVADKHSSGGVGDKTTLVVAPLVAACGIRVGKMSGRGLGHTGGTLDKLESIPGFRVDLTRDEFLQQVEERGIVVTGQTVELAPADGKFYALRDVTATVDSIPLIAASIMSKKIASGANVLVLDVTCGEGAFMKTREDAEHLARTMVDIGKSLGIKVVAEITDMSQPRGLAVGNSLEVLEAINTLKGEGFKEFEDYCVETAARIVFMSGGASSSEEAESLVREKITDKSALEKFRTMVQAQSGDPHVVDDPLRVLKFATPHVVFAQQSGYIARVDPMAVGLTAMGLGGGRQKKGDIIDHSVGVMLMPTTKVAQYVEKDQPLFWVYTNDSDAYKQANTQLQAAIEFSDHAPFPPPQILHIVE